MVGMNASPSSGTVASPPRRRRLPVLLGAVVVVLAGLSVLFHALPTTDDKPARHVIVISLDTTRADHFGCYGNTWIRTPRIDALAAESILLTDYMTVIPTTLASHTTLFTGKYPRGLHDFVVGYVRWGSNVAAYMNLLRDEYPPFSGEQQEG